MKYDIIVKNRVLRSYHKQLQLEIGILIGTLHYCIM